MPLSVLGRYACTAIANGRYWLNYNTGIWGYAGDPSPWGTSRSDAASIRARAAPAYRSAECSIAPRPLGPRPLAQLWGPLLLLMRWRSVAIAIAMR
jgi:hypothetical protein